MTGTSGKPLSQELLIHLTGPSGKLEYMPTSRGHPPPLTLATCHPEWDDYLDLTKMVTEMAHCLMKKDGQEVAALPQASTTPKKEATKSILALVNEGISWVATNLFSSDQQPGASRDNSVHLSNATDASALCSHPRKDDGFDDKAKLLGHFSDALREMAASIMDLEDGYFKALHEVIVETEWASHPSQWAEEDIDVVRQTRYKMDLQRFQTYRRNKVDPSDLASINTKDHSTYIEVAKADPGSVIRKSVFSVVAYREVLNRKGFDVSRFDKEVDTMFKKGPRGSRAPDTTKVPIKQVMLVCQCENGVNVKYSDSDRFGRPRMMGLWDLHSSDALSLVKMQLPTGPIDANFCPCCAFYSTNNETLNNHVRKHYGMGLTCRADGFTMASVGAMKAHMESEHGYEGKCASAGKKAKGKG